MQKREGWGAWDRDANGYPILWLPNIFDPRKSGMEPKFSSNRKLDLKPVSGSREELGSISDPYNF